MKKNLAKTLKITGISLAGILLLLFLLPILFPGAVVGKIKNWTNQSLEGELDFAKVRLSFFNHFPSLTVTLYDVTLKGSAPFKKDTLIAADEIALGINIKSLVFDSRINIDKIFVSDAFMNVQVNEKGEANYNVYVSENKPGNSTDTSTAALRLEKIHIEHTRLIYNDRSVELLLDAKGLNYTGNGDLSKAIFDLYSHAAIDSLDFYLGNEPYLLNKNIDADLITKVNTHSLAFFFEKNQLKINKLPVQFSGKLDFLQNGYDIDFTVRSDKSKLHDLITALPPQYITWLEKTEVKGITDLLVTLKGQYIASSNTMPDLGIHLNLRDGFVAHEKAPLPASNIFLNLAFLMPSINTDSMEVKIDSVFLNVGKDYLKGRLNTKGLSKPYISAQLHSAMDLEKLNQAFGWSTIGIKGHCAVNIAANGTYHPQTSSFPVCRADIRLSDGVIQSSYYPHPIDQIQLSSSINNHSGSLKDLEVLLPSFSFRFEGKPFSMQASLKNFENIIYDIKAKGDIDVARVYKVFRQEGLDLSGFISADLALKGSQDAATAGKYDQLQNQGTLQLRDIKTYSSYFPKPFLIKDGIFRFNQDKMSFDTFKVEYGQSDFLLNGHLQNVIDYIFSTKGILKGSFTSHSGYINGDEFVSSAAETAPADTAAASVGVVVIPPLYDLSLAITADKVFFNDLTLEQLTSAIAVQDSKLFLKETGFTIIGSKTTMNAEYGSISPSKAYFDYHIRTSDFDVKRAYNEIKLFHDLVTAAEKAEGIVSLDYQLKGKLDGSMMPVYPSLEGGGTLSLKDVKVKGLKLFSLISKKTAKDSINNPNLRQVNITSTIKNNVITLERFKFKVFGFRPRIEGKTNFDGQMNLKMRLGLPPLGIIGIPISVTGTQEDPKVKLGKNDKEEVLETQYQEETPPKTPS